MTLIGIHTALLSRCFSSTTKGSNIHHWVLCRWREDLLTPERTRVMPRRRLEHRFSGVRTPRARRNRVFSSTEVTLPVRACTESRLECGNQQPICF